VGGAVRALSGSVADSPSSIFDFITVSASDIHPYRRLFEGRGASPLQNPAIAGGGREAAIVAREAMKDEGDRR